MQSTIRTATADLIRNIDRQIADPRCRDFVVAATAAAASDLHIGDDLDDDRLDDLASFALETATTARVALRIMAIATGQIRTLHEPTA